MSQANPRLRALFCDALEILDASERSAFLDKACAGDGDLRRRVEALLTADSRAGCFLSGQPARPDLEPARHGERLGRYRILERIGQGGCGVVYRAWQEEPVRREVALKILKLGMDTRSVVMRFELERQALAVMDHPNIARVLDAGATDSGRPFFVMDLVRGEPITDYCQRRALSLPQRLELVIQICQAVQHAHQKGIIHRDLKPSNILVVEIDGAPTPKVIDFGIAKAAERTADRAETAAHEFVGTPAYMSPEQVAPGMRDIDTRCDVYGVGVVLYELMAGQPPFDPKVLHDAGLEEIHRIIRDVDPPKPSSRIMMQARRTSAEPAGSRERLAALRSDVDWIVMKCLEKDRTRRYQTVTDLAADLRRHLEHEPVSARSPSVSYRFLKQVRRNRLLFSAGGIIAAALLAAVMVSVRSAVRATRAERQQHQLRGIAEARANEIRQQLIRRYVSDGNRLAEQGLPVQALPWLVGALELETGDPARERYERLRIAQLQLGAPELRLHLAQGRWVHAIALSADGSRLAAGSDDGVVRVSRMPGGDAGAEMHLPAAVGTVRFSPDGQRLAAMDVKGNARVWSVRNGEPLTPMLRAGDFDEGSGAVQETSPSLSFAADGRALLLARGSKAAELRDSGTGALLREFRHDAVVHHAAFSRDGLWIVTSAQDGTVRVWETKTGRVGAPELSLAGAAVAAGFSPDALRLFTLRDGRFVQVWDWREARPVGGEYLRRARVTHASWSPDGGRILSVAGSGLAFLHEAATASQLDQFVHPGRITDASFSPDGDGIAVACDDGNVWLWSVSDARRRPLLLPVGNLISEITFSADGRYLAAAARGGYARVWELSQTSHGERRLAGSGVQEVAFDPSGKRALLVNTGARSGLAIYNPDTAELTASTPISRGQITRASFSPDGRHILAFGEDLELLVIASDSGAIVRQLPHPDRVRDAAWSGDGRFIFATREREVQKWDWDSAGIVASFVHSGPVQSMSVSGDGLRLATGQQKNPVILWNATTGARLLELPATKDSIRDVRFSPDGEFLAVSSHAPSGEGLVDVWNASSGERVGKPLRHRDAVLSFAFSPEGRRLATACADHSAHVWDTATGEAVAPWLPHEFEAEHAAFSSDGTMLVTRARRGAVRLWNAQTGEPLSPQIQYLRNASSGAVSFSPDGRRLLICRGADEAWLRDVAVERASVRELKLRAELASCSRLDSTAGMVPLDSESLRRAWLELESLRPPTP